MVMCRWGQRRCALLDPSCCVVVYVGYDRCVCEMLWIYGHGLFSRGVLIPTSGIGLLIDGSGTIRIEEMSRIFTTPLPPFIDFVGRTNCTVRKLRMGIILNFRISTSIS